MKLNKTLNLSIPKLLTTADVNVVKERRRQGVVDDVKPYVDVLYEENEKFRKGVEKFSEAIEKLRHLGLE